MIDVIGENKSMNKINLGSGKTKYWGYTNIDYSGGQKKVPSKLIDIDMDFMKKEALPYDDNNVRKIKCYHLLEHLPSDVVVHLLSECYRVLINHGLLEITLPDPVNENPKQIIKKYSTKTNNMHCNRIYKEDLKILLFSVGFHFVYEKSIDYMREQDYYGYMMVADKRSRYVDDL